MPSVRQYFDSDFDYVLRVRINLNTSVAVKYEAALLYDANASCAFLAFYFEDPLLQAKQFEDFLSSFTQGNTQVVVTLKDGITIPSPRFLHGALRVHNTDPFRVEYQLFGDPSWRDLLAVGTTKRVFIYAETTLSSHQVSALQESAAKSGHELQFRDQTYAKERLMREKPLAFISHDSRDKVAIARPIALNLQRKVCPVWYDEFSLELGANLRQSIEKGLKECKRCVLILSPNFLGNGGWGKREFESIFTREILEETSLVLPIWCGVDKRAIYEYSPSLLNIKGIDWESLGEEEVCRQIYLAVTTAA